MKILALGSTGLLGSNLVHTLDHNDLNFIGSIRASSDISNFSTRIQAKLHTIKDVFDHKELEQFIDLHQPEIIINCLSLRSEPFASANKHKFFQIYSYLPSILSSLCSQNNIRYVHISSDGVFSGLHGPYIETDMPDAQDDYGQAKISGEKLDASSLVIRTSIIGHTLNGSGGLLDWFLDQEIECNGFADYIFSGLTASELCEIIIKNLLPNQDLQGVFNIGGPPISKYNLLNQIAKVYNKKIIINEKNSSPINRVLNSSKFMLATNYQPKSWELMLQEMLNLHLLNIKE